MRLTERENQMTKLKVLCTCTIMLLALATMVAGQVVYDSVRVGVEPGTTCPPAWTASTESITTEDRYIVQVPASIGGRAFRVTSSFVNAVWPSSTDKSAAVASGVLVTQAGSTVEVHYCALLP